MEKRPAIGILEEFRLEFEKCWQRLPNKALFFGLLAAWLALFQFYGNSTFGYVRTPSLLRWMYKAYHPDVESPFSDDGHGLMIPVVVLGILWFKRRELLGLELKAWGPGLGLVLVGLFFHVLGYAAQQPRVSIVGLFVGIYGLTGVAWGPVFLRHTFFPFFLFAFSVPLGTLAEPVTLPLRLWVSRIVEWLSNTILGVGILRQGTQLMDPSGHYQYDLAVACSGMRSLIATTAFALIYGWLTFPRTWKRATILLSALPLAVLGNVTRMMAIVIASELGGEAAGHYVHDGGPGGILSLLPYVPAFGGLLLIGHWLREPQAPTTLGLEVQPS